MSTHARDQPDHGVHAHESEGGDHGLEKSTVSDDLERRSPQARKVEDDIPPDGGYGWVCTACVFLINAHTWGINSSYAVFLAHYLATDTFPGASPLEYAFIGGLSISLSLIIAPLATLSTSKFGTKATLSIGILFETAGLLGASWADQIWHLFLTQGVAFGFGMGFLYSASVGIIPQWFSKKRSFANSIGSAGSGVGGMIYSLATDAMIKSIGLGWAFRIIAIVSFAVNGICTIIIRDRNKAVGSIQLAFDIRLFKRLEFLFLLGWGFLTMLGYIVLLFSLPNYARSIGLSARQGSIIGALLNVGQAIGRPLVGLCSDAAGRINLAGACTFLTALFSFVIWIFAKSYGVLIFFSILVGTVAGTFWATIGPVGAEVVGLRALPSALSIVWVVLVLPCTFSEPIGLQLRTTSGDEYLHAQIFVGFMYIGAAVCMWFLRAWKVGELEREAVSKERRELEIRDDDAVPRHRTEMTRHISRTASVKKASKGLWSWQRV